MINPIKPIKLGYSHCAWTEGYKRPILWDTCIVPHICIAGITGSSKTVLGQLILNQLLDTDAEIVLLDYKGDSDWSGITQNYAEFSDCGTLFERWYLKFQSAVMSKKKENVFIIFDEICSYSLSLDAKEFKLFMARLSHLTFMGRSFGYHLIVISQRFEARVMDTAIRDQFGIKICMGSSISTEAQTMLFPNSEIDKNTYLPRFCGYISTPERGLDIIQIPFIENPERLKRLLMYKGEKRDAKPL